MRFLAVQLSSLLLVTLTSAVLLTSLGCDQNNMPKYQELDRLRVLALSADVPEARAGGGNVTVTPYVSDNRGGGRALTYSAESCLLPTVDYGADPTCVGNATRQVLATNVALTGLNTANGYTGATNAITVTVPAAALLAGLSSRLLYNGVPLIVVFEVRAATGESVTSFRRILLTTDATKALNSNPSLTNLLSNGVALTTVKPTGTVNLTPAYSGTPETYSEISSEGSLTSRVESYTMTWFSSQGEIQYSRTSAAEPTEFDVPATVTNPLVLVGVLRDNRGGVSIVQKSLN